MPSESQDARLAQKAYSEEKLGQRISELKEKGLASDAIKKDAAVRKLRAEVRRSVVRLDAIRKADEKREEMARLKAEKAAAPKKGKKDKKAEETSDESKRQKKKKKKKEAKAKKQDE